MFDEHFDLKYAKEFMNPILKHMGESESQTFEEKFREGYAEASQRCEKIVDPMKLGLDMLEIIDSGTRSLNIAVPKSPVEQIEVVGKILGLYIGSIEFHLIKLNLTGHWTSDQIFDATKNFVRALKYINEDFEMGYLKVRIEKIRKAHESKLTNEKNDLLKVIAELFS